jgi:hypothetical protein
MQSGIVIDDMMTSTGQPVASGSTITASGSSFHITGTASISTMNLPPSTWNPTVCAIADGAWSVATGGNFAAAYTAAPATRKCWQYDPFTSLWY